MKNLKKIFAVVLILVLVFALVGCINPTSDSEGEITIVVGETEYVVELSKVKAENGLLSVLEYLKNNNGLVYETTTDSYGTMITKANELQQNVETGTYLYLYTSVEKDFDVSEYAQTKEYKGKTLTSSGVGAGLMSLEKDCIILITTITYTF